MEGGHHLDSLKIHCTMEKRLNAVRKQNGGAIQHSFHWSLWLDIDLMQRDVLNVLVILYVWDTQYSFVYFTVKTKAYNVIISHAVQLWLLFKKIVSFLFQLYCWAVQHHCKVVKVFFEPPGISSSSSSRSRGACSWLVAAQAPAELWEVLLLHLFTIHDKSGSGTVCCLVRQLW